MQKQTEAVQPISHDDLKNLAAKTGPCVTIYFPTQPAENTSRQDTTRLREGIHQAQNHLTQSGLDKNSTEELLAPVKGLTKEEWETAHGTLVILRSPDVFRHFQLPVEMADSVFVGDSFHLLPALRSLQQQSQEFYILALSQKHVRLLQCTRGNSHEVPLGADVPTSLEHWLNTRMPNASPDHGTTQNSDTGPLGNFTSTTDMDNKDQHIANFYRNVNKHVVDTLRDDTRPLVPAGVDYEISMYRDLNTYPHLVEGGVHGSPESLKGGELHKRALEAVQPFFDQPLQRALLLWEKFGGTERVSAKVDLIVKGAFEARVAHLFVKEGAQLPGSFDRSTLVAGGNGPQEDLINLAAMQTIAMGGDVFVTDPKRVPGDSPMAAVFRY